MSRFGDLGGRIFRSVFFDENCVARSALSESSSAIEKFPGSMQTRLCAAFMASFGPSLAAVGGQG